MGQEEVVEVDAHVVRRFPAAPVIDTRSAELFDAQGGDVWPKLGRNVGWINFQKMEELAAAFKTSARFPRVMQLNKSSLNIFKTCFTDRWTTSCSYSR